MFERYTEPARRAIFFARYEASQLGSSYIETEHLLLGLLREDRALRSQLFRSYAEIESVRKEIESRATIRERVSTSVDMPLSQDCKRALEYAAEESKALQHNVIDSGHLVLGLLRLETSTAASILQQHGIDYKSYREIVRTSPTPTGSLTEPLRPYLDWPLERPSAWHPHRARAPSLQEAITALETLMDRARKHFHLYSHAYGEKQLKRKPWSRKQALGHLIDYATAHHQWLARALTEPALTASGYPLDDWVAAQQYQNFSWQDIVDLWVCLNRLLMHVIALIPEEKLNTTCRIGIDEPISLLELVNRYLEHCEDMVGQILARL